MRKILLITGSPIGQGLAKQITYAGIPPKAVLSFCLHENNEDKVLELISRERPAMIILDGRLHGIRLTNLHQSIGTAIGVHDIDTNMYSIEKKIPLPGVIPTTIEEISKAYKELTATAAE